MDDNNQIFLEKVWSVMRQACIRKAMKRTRSAHGDGYYIVTSISKFIRATLNEYEVSYDERMVSDIRRALRSTGNVIAVEPYNQIHWKIWVTETFQHSNGRTTSSTNANGAVGVQHNDSIDRRARKLSQAEAGEDRAPQPVKIIKMSIAADKYISLYDYYILKSLSDLGGRTDYQPSLGRGKANATSQILNNIKTNFPTVADEFMGTSSTANFTRLVERGYVKYKADGRISKFVELTPDGQHALANPYDVLTPWMAVVLCLYRNRKISRSKGVTLTKAFNQISDSFGENVLSYVSTAQGKGYVKVVREGRTPKSVSYCGPDWESSPEGSQAPQQTAIAPGAPVSPEQDAVEQTAALIPDDDVTSQISFLIEQTVERRLAAALAEAKSESTETVISMIAEVIGEVEHGKRNLLSALAEIKAAVEIVKEGEA